MSLRYYDYFSGDKNSDLFAKPIVAINKWRVPGIKITEVFENILRQRNEESALEAIAQIEHGIVIVLDGEWVLNSSGHWRIVSFTQPPENIRS